MYIYVNHSQVLVTRRGLAIPIVGALPLLPPQLLDLLGSGIDPPSSGIRGLRRDLPFLRVLPLLGVVPVPRLIRL